MMAKMKSHGKSHLPPWVQPCQTAFLNNLRGAYLTTLPSTLGYILEKLVQKEDIQECLSQHYLSEQKLETSSLFISGRTNNYFWYTGKINYYTPIKINEPRL